MFLPHVQALTKPLLPHHYLRTTTNPRFNTITSTRPLLELFHLPRTKVPVSAMASAMSAITASRSRPGAANGTARVNMLLVLIETLFSVA